MKNKLLIIIKVKYNYFKCFIISTINGRMVALHKVFLGHIYSNDHFTWPV